MASIAVIVDDAMAKELQRRLSQFQHLSGRFPDLYKKMTNLGETQTRHRIEEEQTGPEGETWPEWSPKYEAWRDKKGFPNQGKLILHDWLVRTLDAFVDKEQAGWGTDRPYAAAQQFGRPEIHLPARPYLGISEANLAELADVLEEWAWSQLNG